MKLGEKRKRRSTERTAPEVRIPVKDYPGVFKLPGKEVYAIKLNGMETERVVRSWRTVARALERMEGFRDLAIDNRVHAAGPELVPLQSIPRRRTTTVPPRCTGHSLSQ